MEMTLEHQKHARRRREELPASVRDGTFTPDELAQILRDANSRQSSPEVSTIDEALETARELAIDERHVLAAAKALQEKKIRRDVLRRRSRSRLMKLVRYLGTMAFVVTLVSLLAGLSTGKVVALGMGIGAFVMVAQWIRALFDERFPPEKP